MAGKVVKQLAGSGTGQSFSDMMSAMKHTLSGSLVDKIICKATTEEYTPPKRKHLTYLVRCTFEPRLSILDFANHIVSRTKHTNSVVVFKALITIHHLMQYGSERFLQYFASDNLYCNDRISNPDTNVARFIIPYARYLDERAASYRSLAFDLCRVKLGKEDGFMRQLQLPKLFNAIPVIEKQLDVLLQFQTTRGELTNPLLKFCHMHMYRDLIRLYAVLNEVMINLIGKYFTMSKRDCKVSLSAYRSFLKRMDNINDFIKLSEATDTMFPPGSDGPTSSGFVFQPVPPTVLEALECHLAVLEGQKQSESKTGQQQQQPEDSGAPDASSLRLSAAERQRIIEEERRRLESYVTSARQRAVPLEEKESDCMSATSQSPLADLVGDLLSSDDQQVEPAQGAFHAPAPDAFRAPTAFGYSHSAAMMAGTSVVAPPVSAFGLPNNHLTHQPSLALVPAAVAPVAFSAPVNYAGQPVLPNTYVQQQQPLVGSVSLNPFLAQPVRTPSAMALTSSRNPFLASGTNSVAGFATNSQVPVTSYSANHAPQSANPAANGNLPNQQAHPVSTTNDGSALLSARLAELVDNLSIGGTNHSGTGPQQLLYRAPDGNRTAVNWANTPFAQQQQLQQQHVPVSRGDGFGQASGPFVGQPAPSWPQANPQIKPVYSASGTGFAPMNANTQSFLQLQHHQQQLQSATTASGQPRSSTNPFAM